MKDFQSPMSRTPTYFLRPDEDPDWLGTKGKLIQTQHEMEGVVEEMMYRIDFGGCMYVFGKKWDLERKNKVL